MAELLTGAARDDRRTAVGDPGGAMRELVDAVVRTEVDAAELAAVPAGARELAARLRSGGRGLEGRRSTARARIVAAAEPDIVLAEGEGLFVALRPDAAASTFAGVSHAVEAWTARD